MPMLLAATPLPIPLITPPVTTTYFLEDSVAVKILEHKNLLVCGNVRKLVFEKLALNADTSANKNIIIVNLTNIGIILLGKLLHKLLFKINQSYRRNKTDEANKGTTK